MNVFYKECEIYGYFWPHNSIYHFFYWKHLITHFLKMKFPELEWIAFSMAEILSTEAETSSKS